MNGLDLLITWPSLDLLGRYLCVSALLLCISCVFSMAANRIKGVEAEMNKVTQNGQPMAHFLKDIFNTENPVLTDLPRWSQESCVGSENPEESEVNNYLFWYNLSGLF